MVTSRRAWLVGWGRDEARSYEEIRSRLWNADVEPAAFPADDGYQAAIMEQYKIYVEMADRISARRALTNTFFLTLNTAVLAVVGASWEDRPSGMSALLALPVAGFLVQCLAWFWLIRSYRQLNSAKYLVVGALEERLPASPYLRAEWWTLGGGNNRALYWPLVDLEQVVPLLFAGFYLTALLFVLIV